MTAAQQAKAYGLKNLKQVETATGTNTRTLRNWHTEKPDLFNVVCIGVAALQEVES